MRIRPVLALQRFLRNVLPVSVLELYELNGVDVDAWAQLGDEDEDCEEPPLADEREVEFVGENGEEDTDGVGGVEEVDQEEVVFGGGVVVASGLRGDEQGDGEFLALGELVFGVLEVP